jgi:hypothetical protein
VSRRIQFGNALRGRRSRLILLALVLVVSVTPAFAHATRATRSTRVARSTRTARMTRRTSFVSTRRVGPENPHRTSAAHRSLWTPLFQPSRESMVIQNEEIDRLGLPRIQNEEQLEELVASGDLLPITPNQTLRIDPRLDPERRYCRPWTLDFVNDLSEAYFREFHDQIQINSAVRTVEVQERLRRYNSNAAPESGDLASSHLAGITVDIQRLGMTMAEIKWVEQYMLPLKEAGMIEPEEERHQRCFHVMVSDRYEDFHDPQARATTGPSAGPRQLKPAPSDAPDATDAP